jgi:hypothetical protein
MYRSNFEKWENAFNIRFQKEKRKKLPCGRFVSNYKDLRKLFGSGWFS